MSGIIGIAGLLACLVIVAWGFWKIGHEAAVDANNWMKAASRAEGYIETWHVDQENYEMLKGVLKELKEKPGMDRKKQHELADKFIKKYLELAKGDKSKKGLPLQK